MPDSFWSLYRSFFRSSRSDANQLTFQPVFEKHNGEVHLFPDVPADQWSYAVKKALRCAISKNDIEEFKSLVERGAPVFMPGWKGSGFNAAAEAAKVGNLEIVKLALELGATTLRHAPFEPSPLEIAAQEGHAEIVKTLLKERTQDDRNDDEALIYAIKNRHLETTRMLLDGRSDDAVESGEFFRMACAYSSAEIVELFLDRGVDVHLGDDVGLRSAFAWSNYETARCLLENGADIRVRGTYSEEPDFCLVICAQRNDVEMARLALEFGADPDANNGEPMLLAALNNYKAFAELLFEYGADPEKKSMESYKFYNEASVGGHVELAALIKEKIEEKHQLHLRQFSM